MKLELSKRLRAACEALRASAVALLIAASLVGLFVGPAAALYNDQTRIFPTRSAEQKLTYYRITINWNDTNISTGQQFGTLAANAYIDHIDCTVNTAFNAGSTNVITIGTTKANANEIVASGITAGSTGVYHLTSAAGLGTQVSMGSTWLNTAMPLFAKYAQTGTAATAGQVVCLIAFATNDDM